MRNRLASASQPRINYQREISRTFGSAFLASSPRYVVIQPSRLYTLVFQSLRDNVTRWVVSSVDHRSFAVFAHEPPPGDTRFNSRPDPSREYEHPAALYDDHEEHEEQTTTPTTTTVRECGRRSLGQNVPFDLVTIIRVPQERFPNECPKLVVRVPFDSSFYLY